MQVEAIYTVHLVKLFLFAKLVCSFFRQVAHLNDSE